MVYLSSKTGWALSAIGLTVLLSLQGIAQQKDAHTLAEDLQQASGQRSMSIDQLSNQLKDLAATSEQNNSDPVSRLAHELQKASSAEFTLYRADAMRDAQANEPDPLFQSEGNDEKTDEATEGGVDENTEEPSEGDSDQTDEEPAVDDATPVDEDAPAPRELPVKVDTSAANADLSSKLRAIEKMEQDTEKSIKLNVLPPSSIREDDAKVAPKPKPYTGDPLKRKVNLDFREMELSNVVALLAHMAEINVIAGTDIIGTVTAQLKDVPLLQAMETVLRMNDLGMVEEEGIYHIVTYTEAISAQRETIMVNLQNAKASEVKSVLDEIIKGSPYENMVASSANDTANVIVISGPKTKIGDMIAMANQLDISEPVLPTITEVIKLNYAEPDLILPTVEKLLNTETGTATADIRARHIIVTDVPIVVEQIRTVIKELDIAVKSVSVDAMIVDANLEDDAQTGTQWLMSSIRRQSRRGENVGNLSALNLATNTGIAETAAGVLNFGLLSSNFDWRGVIQAEIRNLNGNLVSNPNLIATENKPAKITITKEIPFIEVQQTSNGGNLTNTEFKEIGTLVEITPRVTHDNSIIAEIQVKESDTTGEFNGIPIEDKREITNTLHMQNGQTILMGGLRKNDEDLTIKKIPILGDVPVLNFLFRSNTKNEVARELLIFMTCNVIDPANTLDDHSRSVHDENSVHRQEVDAQRSVFHEVLHPEETRDPFYKWHRAK